MLRQGAGLIVAMLLLAGCAGPDASPQSSKGPSAPAAPEPTVGVELGSITGNVTDEELVPLSGAQVALVETAQTVTSDAAGKFTFNDLAPGSYRVVATRLGYAQAAKKLDVKAGEITSATFTMESIVIEEEGYLVSIPSTFYITFGWGLFDAFVTWRVSNSTCNPCQRHIDFERGPVDVRAEPVWQPSIDTPATNKILYIWTERNTVTGDPSSGGENVWSEYVDNREQHRFTEEELEMLKEFEDFRINVGGGVTDVMVQQKVDVWFTAAYVEELAEGFTALPPA